MYWTCSITTRSECVCVVCLGQRSALLDNAAGDLFQSNAMRRMWEVTVCECVFVEHRKAITCGDNMREKPQYNLARGSCSREPYARRLRSDGISKQELWDDDVGLVGLDRKSIDHSTKYHQHTYSYHIISIIQIQHMYAIPNGMSKVGNTMRHDAKNLTARVISTPDIPLKTCETHICTILYPCHRAICLTSKAIWALLMLSTWWWCI